MATNDVLRTTSLVLLAAQNLSYGLLMAECRKKSANGHMFFGPTAVLLMEIGKLVLALCGNFIEQRENLKTGSNGIGKQEYIALASSPDEEDDSRQTNSRHSSEELAVSHDSEQTLVDNEGENQEQTASEHLRLQAPCLTSKEPVLSHADNREGKVARAEVSSGEDCVHSTPFSLVDDHGRDGLISHKSIAEYDAAHDESVLKNSSSSSPLAGRVKQITFNETCSAVMADIFDLGAFRISVPALLYVVQNNLLLFGAGYMLATEFQVFSQMKLVTTAVFSVLVLGKELNKQHWLSILLLVLGVIIAQVSSSAREDDSTHVETIKHAGPVTGDPSTVAPVAAPSNVGISSQERWQSYLGVVAVLAACVASGLAAVLLEKLYKSKRSFWTLNVHLSFFSLIPAFVPIFADSVSRGSFDPLRYFTGLVWLLVAVNVAGGLIVAMVLKFADNILKGFAISAALILTLLISAFVAHTSYFSIVELGGIVAIVLSMFIYGKA